MGPMLHSMADCFASVNHVKAVRHAQVARWQRSGLYYAGGIRCIGLDMPRGLQVDCWLHS